MRNLKTRIDNMTIRNIKIINILCMRNSKKCENQKLQYSIIQNHEKEHVRKKSSNSSPWNISKTL
jgi:hypothetical protein